MRTARVLALSTLVSLLPAASFAGPGILLLAHGGDPQWNARVLALAKQVDERQPTEVAFGMATRRTIQAAADRLAARGVTEIVAVPLFISSWSSVVTSTEYLLGLRPDAPPILAMLAKMDHGDGGAPTTAVPTTGHDHAAMAADPVPGTTPVVSTVPIRRLTSALNAHPIVADILTTRARALSRTPAQEAVLIVAHGPTSEAENRLWLRDMDTLASTIGRAEPFASIDYLTVKDDAPAPVRDAATAQLRALVTRRITEGRRVLIVPLLLSFGGIERGIATRLDGLSYAMADSALMPDDRLVAWVLEMAAERR